jgi:hypothetical protein
MATFAEAVIVEYCLSFADQGQQTALLRLHQINRSCSFLEVPFSVYIYMENGTRNYIHICRHFKRTGPSMTIGNSFCHSMREIKPLASP